MSQSNKRSAETAFEDGAENKSQSRKRRHRNRGVKAESPSKDRKSAIAQATSAKSSTQSRNEASKDKLEDRTSLPTQRTDKANVQANDLAASKRSKKHKKTARSLEKGASNQAIEKQNRDTNSWTMSSAIGGTFIDHDPILTADGKYMVLLTKDHVNVYSTSTSLLVRAIAIRENHTISGCSLSATEPNVLFVATEEGVLVKLDLTSGSRIGQWKVESGVRDILSVSGDGSTDSVLATRDVETRNNELLLVSLPRAAKAETKTLLRSRKFIKSVRSSTDASVIAVCSPQGVHLGVRTSPEITKYNWYVFTVPGTIISFDIRTTTSERGSKPRADSVNVVVGLRNGAIFVYEDALEKLIKQAKIASKTELSGRRLHWHRGAVQSVKWSRDGNYIISGGEETVLVIWQLETNQQQFLPHLSTAIYNIVVSPSGAHYGIRLGDNSVMVLSTADLTPSTNVSGLSLPVRNSRKFQMQLHPTNSNQMLAAVPIKLGGGDASQPATHLQVYDIDTNLQLSRQALTRNVTTTVNVSPDGQPIQEPDITYMSISSDGNWLATLEKWCPNSSDTQALYLEEDQASQDKAVEVALRFWRWDADQNTWEIVTRIDKPHADGRCSILSIASNPVAIEFSTIGSDGSVNIWQPKKRVRDGVQIRNKAGQPLFTWSCTKAIHIEKTHLEIQQSAALTYSEDGTVLIASWSGKQRHVHIVDRSTGKLCMSLPNLLGEGLAHIETTGRNLLCLSTDLKIFDMITLQTTFVMEVKPHSSSFLALNPRSNSFAIGLNSENSTPGAISVFDIENPDQGSMKDFELPAQIHALLADPVGRGFVVIDHNCRIRKIIPPGSRSTTSSALTQELGEIDEVGKSLEDIFGHGRGGATAAEGQQKLIEDGGGSRNLAELLSATSTAAQPGIGELFDLVSRAVAGAQVNVKV